MPNRTIFILMAVVSCILIFPTYTLAEDEQTQFMENQLERLQLEEIQTYWDELANEYGGFIPENQKGSMMEFVTSKKKFSIKEALVGLLQFFLHELVVNGKLLGSLILLTIFCTVLQTLQNAFEQHTISKVAYAITYMVLMVIALNSFHIAIQYAKDAVATMNHFLIALLPLLLAFLASIGNVASAALFHPLIVFLVHTTSFLIQHIVLPLIFLSAILYIVSTLTDQYKVTKLASFLQMIALGLLGIFLTVFLGVVSVQGASSAVVDGMTIRTAKFLAENLVPVVGKMFTDATETVFGASLILKNTVGLAGLVILLFICAFPALKVLSLAIIFNGCAAILQPLGSGAIIQCLSTIGRSTIIVFAAMAVVCLMFFLAITIMIAAGNVSVMVR